MLHSVLGLATLGLLQYEYEPDPGGFFAFGAVTLIIYLAIFILVIAGLWKVFEKAGKPGWAAIIPIYNIIVMVEIVGKPMWWAIMILIVPCANIVFMVMLNIELAKSFGKDIGYAIGLILLPFIFVPMLGFGDATYEGPSA
jgi:hypothetical protein